MVNLDVLATSRNGDSPAVWDEGLAPGLVGGGGGEEKPSAQARERGPRQDRYQTRVVAEMLGVASVLDMFLGISAEQDPGQTAA